jgi:hypothetical protein
MVLEFIYPTRGKWAKPSTADGENLELYSPPKKFKPKSTPY